MGHTHKSFVLNLNGKLFINPGSVGKPAEGSPDSSYGVIELETGYAQIHRTSYDVEKNVELVRKVGLPEEIAKSLSTGLVD